MDQKVYTSESDISEQAEDQRPEWDRIIEEHRKSGMSAARYCREHGINYKMFLYSRKKLRQEKMDEICKGSKFVRMMAPGVSRIRLIFPHEVILEAEQLPEARWIAALMKAL